MTFQNRAAGVLAAVAVALCAASALAAHLWEVVAFEFLLEA